MRIEKINLVALVLMVGISASLGWAQLMQSTSFQINSDVFSHGGGAAGSSSFDLLSVVGEGSGSGSPQSASFQSDSGFGITSQFNNISSTAHIRINEVAPAQTGGKDIVEFFVGAPAKYADFKFYEIANAIGAELVKTFPSSGVWAGDIPAGTFIILNFNSTLPDETAITNNIINLYTTDTGLQATDNVLLLSNSTGTIFQNGLYQSGLIVDIVAYANQNTDDFGNQSSQMKSAINAAVTQGQWTKVGSNPIEFDCANSRGVTGSGKGVARDLGNLAHGESVSFEYKNATVQSSSGTAVFLTSSDETGTNVAALSAGSPSLVVVGGSGYAPKLPAPLQAADFSKSRCFPNPIQMGSGTQFDAPYITMDNLPVGTVAEVYTVDGVKICDLGPCDSSGILRWDCKNASGQHVGPGIYICPLRAPSGAKKMDIMVVE